MKKKISFGFSPCPNDTFMFCALINGMIDTDNILFEPLIDDVEKLNLLALKNKTDITKMSVSAFSFVSPNYLMLNAGSALGKNCGPLLICKRKVKINANLKIAIPGKYTTANLLLSIFYPGLKAKSELVFSEIENALLNDEYDAGVIIHENRFTYEKKGLQKISDLGELWEQTTKNHIPLGCIAIKKSINRTVAFKIDSLINQSIQFAISYPEKVMPFVKHYAQEMEEVVLKQHINLYVNNFSLALGTEGKNAIELLLFKGAEAGILPEIEKPIFIS